MVQHTYIFEKSYKFENLVLFLILVCPTGSYLNSNNNNACELCPVDTYGSSTNVGSCSNCPSLTNTQGQTGQTSVNACGTFSLPILYIVRFFSYQQTYPVLSIVPIVWLHITSFSQFVLLDLLSIPVMEILAELCPVNSYSTGIGSSSCQDCPTGTTTEGQRGQSSSGACGKGWIRYLYIYCTK